MLAAGDIKSCLAVGHNSRIVTTGGENMRAFNAESTTDEVIRGVSLEGRVALVTGASAGLGVETARALAGGGAVVVLLARDRGKLEGVLEQLVAADPQAQFDHEVIDLADLDSVRAAAARLLERYPEIHLLVNNAGVMACPLGRTAQGFEMQFGTNHLGHFLLTGLLLPALLAGAEEAGESRVISLSSAGHRFSPVDFEDPNYERRDYDKWAAYGQAKTANSLFALGFERRFGGRGVHANAVHPGAIVTELGRYLTREDREMLDASRPSGQPLSFKSVEQGAATSVWAATAPELAGRGGLYLEDCHVAGPAQEGRDEGYHPYALDPGQADRLWELSEALVGQKIT
jgi:NAD(P)-dependent dehydrogenase (short-subunit alcohol dehydrogenase family)